MLFTGQGSCGPPALDWFSLGEVEASGQLMISGQAVRQECEPGEQPQFS